MNPERVDAAYHAGEVAAAGTSVVLGGGVWARGVLTLAMP